MGLFIFRLYMVKSDTMTWSHRITTRFCVTTPSDHCVEVCAMGAGPTVWVSLSVRPKITGHTTGNHNALFYNVLIFVCLIILLKINQ